jgi:hypothetical protein
MWGVIWGVNEIRGCIAPDYQSFKINQVGVRGFEP